MEIFKPRPLTNAEIETAIRQPPAFQILIRQGGPRPLTWLQPFRAVDGVQALALAVAWFRAAQRSEGDFLLALPTPTDLARLTRLRDD